MTFRTWPGATQYFKARGALSVHVRRELRRRGFTHATDPARIDFPPDVEEIVGRVQPFTVTPPERIAAMVDATRYVAEHVPGAIVECGVARGGSMMAAGLALEDADRDLWLFDTFVGMTEPAAIDIDYRGEAARTTWSGTELLTAATPTAELVMAGVREVVESTGHPAERIHLVAGDVLDTLPDEAPEQIALLRLDTDWYESTRHELEQLYPRVAAGGVVIIDDYGCYEGARRAVDEYVGGMPVLLNRIDYSARLFVKPR